MEIILSLLALIVVAIVAIPAMRSPQNRLLTRVVTSTRLGNFQEQRKAILALYKLFKFNPKNIENVSGDELANHVSNLLEASREFDHRNRVNFGVLTLQIIARNLIDDLEGKESNELNAVLKQLSFVDMNALNDSIEKNISKT